MLSVFAVQWSPPLVFITCFVTAFALIIAVSKDLPDIEGDKKNNIETFASAVGVAKLAKLVLGSLFTMYVVAAAVPFMYPGSFNPVSGDDDDKCCADPIPLCARLYIALFDCACPHIALGCVFVFICARSSS